MDWSEEGIVLSVRTHGETAAIADVFTRERGRWQGLVRGGRSRAMRPVLQPGNIVAARWRARIEDHLGAFSIEPVALKVGALIDSPLKLAGLTTFTTLAKLLPEREAHARLYDALRIALDTLELDEVWPAVLVRFELGVLEELGFGLDLGSCAATGVNDDLVYVSPKTGRAVSAAAGEPWKDKLFALPPFLRPAGSGAPPTTGDVLAGLRLTGHFLHRYVFGPRGLDMPDQRRLIEAHLERAVHADARGG
ncbi:MAG: DNA repair protein RecO [Hyphomicrobiales bacterium]